MAIRFEPQAINQTRLRLAAGGLGLAVVLLATASTTILATLF